jgi:predicted DNA-binding transcriptional regulator AlpA
MSSSPIIKSMAAVQLHENNSGASVQPEQLIPKKMPHSQKPSEADFHRSSDTLDEVSFWRLPEVKAVTGLSKTSIYELVRDKSFPAPVRLGPRAVAWVRSEVRQWALERVRASRSVA